MSGVKYIMTPMPCCEESVVDEFMVWVELLIVVLLLSARALNCVMELGAESLSSQSASRLAAWGVGDAGRLELRAATGETVVLFIQIGVMAPVAGVYAKLCETWSPAGSVVLALDGSLPSALRHSSAVSGTGAIGVGSN